AQAISSSRLAKMGTMSRDDLFMYGVLGPMVIDDLDEELSPVAADNNHVAAAGAVEGVQKEAGDDNVQVVVAKPEGGAESIASANLDDACGSSTESGTKALSTGPSSCAAVKHTPPEGEGPGLSLCHQASVAADGEALEGDDPGEEHTPRKGTHLPASMTARLSPESKCESFSEESTPPTGDAAAPALQPFLSSSARADVSQEIQLIKERMPEAFAGSLSEEGSGSDESSLSSSSRSFCS
ncbi:unnamed protein product, partial [Sphacelaria rigidula]